MCPMQAANLIQLLADMMPAIVAIAVLALFFARRMA